MDPHIDDAIRELSPPARDVHEMLAAMGFPSVLALNAVRQSRAANIDAAMSWIEAHQDEDASSSALLPLPPSHGATASADELAQRLAAMLGAQQRAGGESKMMLVVRADLGMSAGKVGAQCAHAAVGLYQELAAANSERLAPWTARGQKKIVVSARDQGELNRLAAQAAAAGLPTHVVLDAGRTEVAAGSATVLAIGPALDAEVDPVTGGLRLLQ
jgi:PTH2 family peptidyl-tRNA hydrolase